MRQQVYYTVEVRDKNGKLISREKRRSRSFVRQWCDLHYWLAEPTDKTVTDISNTSRTLDRDTGLIHALRMDGAAVEPDKGVVVGTGTTAVTIADYALAAKIAEGTGVGQLSHQAVTLTAPSVVGSECSWTATRVFINGSGATITVTEIGIYVSAQDTVPAVRYFLVVRDVLVTAQAVPDGGAITVVYTIKVTV